MLNLKTVLSRLGEATLTEWLGIATVELLQALNLGSPSPTSLAELVINRYSGPEILLNKTHRKKLLNALKKDEAENVCLLLELSSTNPWDALEELKISQSSKYFFELLNAFNIELPQTQEIIKSANLHTTNVTPDYPLFPHQIEAARKAIEKLRGEHGRVVLHMPTGAGKTRTAMNIISDLLRQQLPYNSVVFWLAHSEELCEQAASEFEKAWQKLGGYEMPVHRHFGGHRMGSLDDIKHGFVVMSLSLAYKTSFSNDEEFFNLGRRTRLVIMDEAHQAIAETYKHVLQILAPNNQVALLGLTATPGRKWLDVDEDIELASFFERQKVTLDVPGYDNPIDYLRAEGYLSIVKTEPIFYTGDYGQMAASEREQIARGFDVSSKALKEVSEDAARNLRIIQRIIEEAQAGEKVLVFACSVEHAETIATILDLKNIKAAAVTGKTPSELRRSYIEQFKNGSDLNILISCDILTTGFDAPKASVAIITRPTQSLVLYSQMVGRVVRGPKANGTATCKVITIVDQVFGFRDLGEAFVFWDDLWD